VLSQVNDWKDENSICAGDESDGGNHLAGRGGFRKDISWIVDQSSDQALNI
jgi:hypothetical protein